MTKAFQASFNGFHLHSDLGLRHDIAGAIKLQPKELAVLTVLAQHAGQVISKEEICRHVWDGESCSDSSIARCVSKIKASLQKAAPESNDLITSLYGKGYCFNGPIASSLQHISDNCLNTLINLSPDFIAFKDAKGRWIAANQYAEKIFSLEGLNWLSKTDLELAEMLPPVYRAALEACVESDKIAWKNKTPSRSFETIPLPDGSKRHFDVMKAPTFKVDGSRDVLIIFGHDVTDITSATERIKLADHVLANGREAVVITDANNNIVAVNKAFTAISGYTEQEALGQNPRILSSGRQDADFYHAMWHRLKVEGMWRGEIWDRRKNGEIYPKWLSISTVHNTNGDLTNYIAVFSDLSEQKAIEHKINFLAHHDPLTRLPNRTLLRDRFNQAVAHCDRNKTQLAVLYIDLDGFKLVNESLGHGIGDRLLEMVAQRLTDIIGDHDTASRFGSDEFVVLLADQHSINSIINFIDKTFIELCRPFVANAEELHTSPSIGIALYPDDGSDFDTLMKMADAAMRQAKDSGKNTYRFYTTQMNIDALQRLNMQKALRSALKNSEFILHYQPQIDLVTKEMVGVEALLRWNKEGEGLIPPAKFIPVAEESGLIVQIGQWVLHEACRQAMEWQTAGYAPFKISVNLSVHQFRSSNLVQTVRKTLKNTGLEARFLELELTESALINDLEDVLNVLDELKELGVSLSIDDFGTGFSSLSYLKNLPIDKIKIDQSFVRNMATDPSDRAIVHSVIQLAHNLQLKVIAEGVETSRQSDSLLQDGCDEVQGYYFSHPLAADQMLGILSASRSEESC